MRKLFKRLWDNERGNALIIVGASLPLIMGAAGLASDTIQWALWKRELQRAADSAAMAGVYAVAVSANVNNAVTADLTHNNHVADFTVDTDIEHSPLAGGYTADVNAVRVLLAAQKELGFSSLFMTVAPTIRATATATIVPTGDYCVVSLVNNASTGISVGGTADVNLGCGMITNSTSMDAAIAFGSSTVDASPIAAVGGIDANDNWADDVQLLPFTLAQADPFANVNPPTPSGCSNFPNNNPNTVIDYSNATLNPAHAAGQTVCYSSDMDIKGDVTLGAATYVMDAASVKMTNTGAKLRCNGCTIILTSSTASTNPGSIGTVDLSGGTANLTAPDTGTYAGISIYQDRRAVTGATNKINGNSASSFQGAFYFPKQQLEFTGTSGVDFTCVQMVAWTVKFSGTSQVSNNCPTGSASQSFVGRSVRLVE